MIIKKTINGVNYHLYKSNRYKHTSIEISFTRKLEKEKLSGFSLVSAMLEESSQKYKSFREQAIAKEDLYSVASFSNVNKTGCLYTVYTFLNFINMEFINEKDYLKNVLEYFHEMTCNPNFHNKKVFDRLKKDFILNIDNKKEIPRALCYDNAIRLMDKDSLTALEEIGTKEDFEKLTPDDLDKYYEDLITNSSIDVFIMGNTDVEKVFNEFIKIFDLKGLNKKIEHEYFNKIKETPIYKEEQFTFNQTQLIIFYNTVDLTNREKEYVFPMFNYIFGGGGLSSKLYKYVREENSLCYGIGSGYKREENLLVVSSSLKYENVPKALELIDKSLNEMINGEFTTDDIDEAKKSFQTTINLAINDPASIMEYYKAEVFLDRSPITEKEKNFLSVTKEEIMSVAKKIKKNTSYVLREAEDERN